MDQSTLESPDVGNDMPTLPVETGDDSGLEGIDATLEAIGNLDVLSKSASENKGHSQSSQGKKDDTNNDDSSKKQVKVDPLPQPKVMVRKIQTRLNGEIKRLLSQANMKKGPYQLNETLQKVRKLKSTIEKMAEASFEYIEELYKSLFRKKVKKQS